MLPVLQIGPFAIQVNLLLLLLGFWLGLEISARTSRRLGLDGDHLYNAGLYAALAAIVAGRLGHVVAFWSAYRVEPLAIVGINTRAFLLWPALVAGLASAALYVTRHRLPWRRVLDAAAPGVLALLAAVSLGNLFAGQANGAPTDIPWAITLWGVRQHPSQVYEMLALVVTLAAVLWVIRTAYVPGRGAWLALLGYGLTRWLLEPFRAESATILGGLRSAQLLGLLLVLLALWGLRQTAGQAQPGDEFSQTQALP